MPGFGRDDVVLAHPEGGVFTEVNKLPKLDERQKRGQRAGIFDAADKTIEPHAALLAGRKTFPTRGTQVAANHVHLRTRSGEQCAIVERPFGAAVDFGEQRAPAQQTAHQ